MYKHSPSRNQRSKGIKVKHVLQICLLVALTCWLIYQVKHSHDKKKEFDDSAKVSHATEQKDGVVKLGRRYLDPRMKDKVIKIGKQDEEEEEDDKHEEVEEHDRSKIDKKEEEEEDIDEEGRGGGEEIDDHDQENDQEDEKERENVDELELEDKDAEENKGQTENDGASRELYKGGGITNTREENYKADDASSAVTHDMQMVATDNQTRIMGKSNNDEIGAGKNPPVKVEGSETANNGSYIEAIATSNGTEGSKNHKNSNSLTAVRIEPQEEDVLVGDKNPRKGSKFQTIDNKLEGNSTLPNTNNPHNFSLTISVDSKDRDPSLKESKKSDGDVSGNVSGKTEEAFDDTKANLAAGIDEKLDEANSETLDELEVDLIDSSDSTNPLEENYI